MHWAREQDFLEYFDWIAIQRWCFLGFSKRVDGILEQIIRSRVVFGYGFFGHCLIT